MPSDDDGVKPNGAMFDALAADLDAALAELTAGLASDPSLWERRRPGHWSVGQQVAHVGVSLGHTADAFEIAEHSFRNGKLPPPPRRGPIQSFVVMMLAERGYMPRGARASRTSFPPDRPEVAPTLDALRRDAERHRVAGGRLDAAQRDRLWIANPFRPAWNYRLPEMVRVHAVHARHHHKLIEEIASAAAARA
jgi:DinB family protein